MTMDGNDPSAGRLSEKFRRSIGVFFLQGDLSSLSDFARWRTSGDSSWTRFRDEFAEAVRGHILTPQVYLTLTDRGDDFGDDADSDWSDMELELREIWHALAPDQLFPWDEPGHQPPYPPDHPTMLGFPSVRLAYAIKNLVDDGNPYLLEQAIRRGTVPHVPALLEHAMRDRWFTPEIWAWMGYGWGTDPSTVTTEVMDRDLRRVWSAVFPDRSYPDHV